MKTHLVFYCDDKCKQEKMKAIMQEHHEQRPVIKFDSILVSDNIYRFIHRINNNLERLNGVVADSYCVCSHYILSPQVLSYMKGLGIPNVEQFSPDYNRH